MPENQIKYKHNCNPPDSDITNRILHDIMHKMADFYAQDHGSQKTALATFNISIMTPEMKVDWDKEEKEHKE